MNAKYAKAPSYWCCGEKRGEVWLRCPIGTVRTADAIIGDSSPGVGVGTPGGKGRKHDGATRAGATRAGSRPTTRAASRGVGGHTGSRQGGRPPEATRCLLARLQGRFLRRLRGSPSLAHK